MSERVGESRRVSLVTQQLEHTLQLSNTQPFVRPQQATERQPPPVAPKKCDCPGRRRSRTADSGRSSAIYYAEEAEGYEIPRDTVSSSEGHECAERGSPHCAQPRYRHRSSAFSAPKDIKGSGVNCVLADPPCPKLVSHQAVSAQLNKQLLRMPNPASQRTASESPQRPPRRNSDVQTTARNRDPEYENTQNVRPAIPPRHRSSSSRRSRTATLESECAQSIPSPPPVHARHRSATPNRSLAPLPSSECNGPQSAPNTPAPIRKTPAPIRKTPPRLPNQKTHHPDIRKPPPEPHPPLAAEDADLRQVDIVIADIADNVTKCNIDQVFKSVYKLESLALRLECPAEMIADMKGDISQSAARGQCYGDHIYKMLKNFKSKCAERRESDITQKMVGLLVDNGYGALVTGGDVSPMPVAAFYQYQRIVGPELTVSKPATTPKEDSGFGSEGSVCGGRRGSIVSQESGTGLRMSAIYQESSPNGHDATGPEEHYITSPNYSAIPESRHGEEDGEPMYEPSYTYIMHQVTPGQK
ncbi:serine/arginine repetitive matrix protein 1-like [Sycon ciliatum]|uniref:serine/arginine repetitive matrix protein 1-like n=1 Tax=Sycon ciliatum TaxID=27933 RepID=UPI0031F62205